MSVNYDQEFLSLYMMGVACAQWIIQKGEVSLEA